MGGGRAKEGVESEGAGAGETEAPPPVPSTERAMPSSPEEFREFAQECLRWAGETKSERHRQALLETARTWIQAALEVERSGLRRNAHFANLGPARPGSRLRLLAESAQ